MKPSSHLLGAIIVGAVLAAGGANAAEGGGLELNGIEVQAEANTTQVVINTSGPPQYTVFKLTAPLRVVIDVQGADARRVATTLPGGGLVTEVTTTQFDDGAGRVGRVIVGLADSAAYDVKSAGNAIVLTATADQPSAAAAAGETATPAPAEARETATPASAEARTAPASDAKPARKLLAIETRKSGNSLVVKLRTDGEPLRYEVKEVADPPRLVVDLYGISTKLKRPTVVKDSNLTRIRVGKHSDKTRIVMDANKGVPVYNVVAAEDGLALGITDQLAQRTAATEASDETTVADVKLDRQQDFYRLSIKVQGPFHERLAADAPRMKILELRAKLPQGLARTIEAGEANSPLRRVSTFVDPDDASVVRIAADLSSEVEHKVWRKGDELFWDFRAAPEEKPVPAVTAAAGLSAQAANASQTLTTAARRYSGKRITIDVKDADILNVLRLIAEVSGTNVIASDEVKGKVTIKLRNVPWDQALDVVLKVKGLGQDRRGGIIRVAPQTTLQKEQELAAQRRELALRALPTSTKLLVVNYANAGEMLPQVEKLLSDRGKATVDARTNVIVISDIKEKLIQAERLVRTLDTQTPQVLIDTRIVEATTSFVRSLGIQWGGGLNMSPFNGNPTGLVFPYMASMTGGADDGAVASPGVPQPAQYAVNYPANSPGTALGMSFGSIGNIGTLNLRLSAAETEGSARIVSAPRVVTVDNKTAKISQGVDIPITVVSAQGYNVQMISAALSMEVTPHVTTDASVLMKIHVSNNVPNFDRQVWGVPSVEKKEADTEVLLHDGDTSVIGGIYTRRQSEGYQYTPFLGKIPLIGWLFKTKSEEDERRELLAFITPHIVNRKQAMIDVTGSGR
ncbi:MAG: type IV pilus secretin PilQ [Deltaproteobacteria bacterium]|nr:type IV pilus secretin PilQ [Deltaproteobacteria bacterium]